MMGVLCSRPDLKGEAFCCPMGCRATIQCCPKHTGGGGRLRGMLQVLDDAAWPLQRTWCLPGSQFCWYQPRVGILGLCDGGEPMVLSYRFEVAQTLQLSGSEACRCEELMRGCSACTAAINILSLLPSAFC